MGEPIIRYEHQLEIHDQKDAAKHLTKVFRQEQLPARNLRADFDAAVERFVQKAEEIGIMIGRKRASREQLRAIDVEKLKLLFPHAAIVESDAVN